MFSKKLRVELSFTASVNDLIFQVQNNHLTIINQHGHFLTTSVNTDDIETLIFFCQKAMNVLSPTPGSVVVYTNDEGPQRVTLLKDEKAMSTFRP